MTTTSYYDYSYSPPVSPKSLPKRKASTQDDDLENHSLISRSFKKLRLNNAKRPSANGAHPEALSLGAACLYPAVSDRVTDPSRQSHAQSETYVHHRHQRSDSGEDFMPLDDTSDRVWVADLDAEIAAIEAEEQQQQQQAGLQLSDTGKEYSKIPDHLLRPNTKLEDPAAGMQMVLYRDPISISVPEEEDAVRKTIIEARRRMREKQSDGPQPVQPSAPHASTLNRTPNPSHGAVSYADDGMEMDLD